MTEFGKRIAGLFKAWFAWSVVISMVLACAGGDTLIRVPVAVGNSATIAPAIAPDKIATLSATPKVQRLSELRAEHDSSDSALAIDPVRLVQDVGAAGAQPEAHQPTTAFTPGLPQPRGPPLT